MTAKSKITTMSKAQWKAHRQNAGIDKATLGGASVGSALEAYHSARIAARAVRERLQKDVAAFKDDDKGKVATVISKIEALEKALETMETRVGNAKSDDKYKKDANLAKEVGAFFEEIKEMRKECDAKAKKWTVLAVVIKYLIAAKTEKNPSLREQHLAKAKQGVFQKEMGDL
jgi:hypothetical protein